MMPCLYCATKCTGDFCAACQSYDPRGDSELSGDQLQDEREEYQYRNADALEIWRQF